MVALLVDQGQVERAGPVGGVQQPALERAPLVAGDPGLAAAGVVDVLGEPADRLVVHGRLLVAVGEVDDAVEAAGLDPVEPALGHPGPLVVAAGDLAVGADADPVGGAEAGGVVHQGLAVLVDLHHACRCWPRSVSNPRPPPFTGAGLGEVEVPLGVGLEVEGELVEAGRHGHVVVERLVEVGLAVAVEVVQPGDPVAAQDVDLVVHDLQAQRLEQPGGEPLPGQLLQLLVDPGDDPDVAAPGRSAADLPSAKKSIPPNRIQDWYGFSSGAVRVSTT